MFVIYILSSSPDGSTEIDNNVYSNYQVQDNEFYEEGPRLSQHSPLEQTYYSSITPYHETVMTKQQLGYETRSVPQRIPLHDYNTTLMNKPSLGDYDKIKPLESPISKSKRVREEVTDNDSEEHVYVEVNKN